MNRDIAFIISITISVIAVSFGVYQNISASNAKGYAYEQAYRVLNVVQQANISTAAKADIADAALETFGTPPPPIDLSRSRADESNTGSCSLVTRQQCAELGGQLAAANTACRQEPAACANADPLKAQILRQGCFVCF